MPATPFRSHAFTPTPNSGETGIMPDLYQLSVGPIGAGYYKQQFARFETLGRAIPSWNSGAAFFTLAWLVLRRMRRPAALYAGVVLALVLLWIFTLHARVPLQVEATACLIAILLLCAVPGFLANGWFYSQVRSQALQTLTQASSIGQARTQLARGSASKKRLTIVAVVQAIISLVLAGLIYYFFDHAAAAPHTPAPSGPPALVIPATASAPALQPEPTFLIPAQSSEPATDPVDPATAETAVADTALAPMPSPLDAGSSLASEASAPATLSTVSAVTAPLPEPTPLVAVVPSATPSPSAVPAPAIVPETSKAPAKTKPQKAEAKPATKPKSQPKPSTTPPTAPSPSTAPNRLIPGKFYLNAGVYAQASNVDRAVKQLQTAKLNTLRQTVTSNKGELTRLRIGPFDNRKQAEQAAATARKLRIDTTIFEQPKPKP